ncbi:MAG: hypothetical protein AAF551_10885 [Bacteroidota bacterium]
MDTPNSDLKPDWLKELQLKSWEPEILLSGIVLYGMFQLPDALDSFLFFFQNEVFNAVNAMGLFVALLKVGINWLIIGLILHLVCRGLWIGMVGLSYSFPKGINHEKLNFRPKYLEKVRRVPGFEEIILRLERVCSFIYSISFLLFMSIVGVYIYAIVLVGIPFIVISLNIDSKDVNQALANVLNNYSSAVLVFGLVGVIDFVTMGYFRRFRAIAFIYWPVYRLFSYLTLARFYRPTYFAMVTNLNRWWLFFFLLVFSFISIIWVQSVQFSGPRASFSMIEIWSDKEGNQVFEGNYQDKKSKRPSVEVQIPSEIIRDDVLRVFIPLRVGRQDSLKKFMNYDSISNIADESFDQGQYYLQKTSEFYRLSIGDSTFKTKMYFQDVFSSKQKGFITYLNIGFLNDGLYELQVEGPKEMYDDLFAIVPFYKLN